MGLRSNVCYRRIKRPYTRVSKKVQSKNFIPGVPGKKIHNFESGKKSPHFNTTVQLIALEGRNIRHNSMESSRTVLSRHLERVGVTNFYMQICKYPHHVLRENPLATGAGADRFQEGMSRAFGKPIGVAAQVFKDDTIVIVQTYKKYTLPIKDALEKCAHKLGIRCRLHVTSTAPTRVQPKILEIIKQILK